MTGRAASTPLRRGLTRPSRDGGGGLRMTLALLSSLLVNLSLLAGSLAILQDLPAPEPPPVAVEIAALGRLQSVTETLAEQLPAPVAEVALPEEQDPVTVPPVEAGPSTVALDAPLAEASSSAAAPAVAEAVEPVQSSEVEVAEVEVAEVEVAAAAVPAGNLPPANPPPLAPSVAPEPIAPEPVEVEPVEVEPVEPELPAAAPAVSAPAVPAAPPPLAQALPEDPLRDGVASEGPEAVAPGAPPASLPFAVALDETPPEPAAPAPAPPALAAETEQPAVESGEPRLAEAAAPPARVQPAPPKPPDLAPDLTPDPARDLPPDLPPEPAAARDRPAPTAGGARPKSPEALLARLEALKDETLQAQENPELWSVIRAVRRQIARCWALEGAGRSRRLRVDIDVAFERDGSLLRARIQQAGEMVVDEAFRSFATGARRALTRCSPFDLPGESYDLWQRFTMRFVASGPPS